jgi:CubicO group peptidase (beta-lactamase class C family)
VSTYSWILVSGAVEKASDDPFFTFMRKQVFEPLGMVNTKADSAMEPSTDRAVFYFPKFAANTRYGPQEPGELDYSCFAGSAAFLSTASDMVRFGLAINSGEFLQPATVQLLQAGQRLYGLGWDLETATLAGEPTAVVGHDGEMSGGMVASLMTFPKQGIVVSVLSNTAYADTFSLGVKLAQAFAEKGRSSK